MAALAAALACAAGTAAPLPFPDACFVRPEAAASAAGSASEPARSHLGVRRKSTQLYEIELTVAGPNLATCSVAGVARFRGSAGREVLTMVVRPDGSGAAARSSGLCQLFLLPTESAIELGITESACRAQGLCGGLVQLQGQRFDLTGQVPRGNKAPCFVPAPR